MRIWNKRTALLTMAAVAVVATLRVGSTMAYFTAYADAKGSVPIRLGFTETIPEETVDYAGKHVTVKNVGDYDCFVRVKAFGPANVNLNYQPEEGWSLGEDGYYYYANVIASGEATKTALNIGYTFPEGEDKKEFNIVVIQECAPVVYDEGGNLVQNWKQSYVEKSVE